MLYIVPAENIIAAIIPITTQVKVELKYSCFTKSTLELSAIWSMMQGMMPQAL